MLIIALVACLALTAGLTTMALAHSSSSKASNKSSAQVACSDNLTSDNTTMNTSISKVASILGLPESQVADAFKQARSQMLDEAIQKRLQQAVANGRLTQDQADSILKWWQSRPEALKNLSGESWFAGVRRHHGRLWAGCPQTTDNDSDT